MYTSDTICFLVDNDEVIVLWIGSSVSPQVLLDLFGVETPHDIDPSLVRLCLLLQPLVLKLIARSSPRFRVFQRSFPHKCETSSRTAPPSGEACPCAS